MLDINIESQNLKYTTSHLISLNSEHNIVCTLVEGVIQQNDHWKVSKTQMSFEYVITLLQNKL